MPRKCLLCSSSSELRVNIEQFVEDGGSYVNASKYAKGGGLEISHTSIQRHVENHTKIEYVTQTNGENGYPLEVIAEPLNLTELEDLNDKLNVELREILGNLTVLCNSKLKAYMRNESRFPRDEFRAFQGNCELLMNVIEKTKKREAWSNSELTDIAKLANLNFED